MSKLPIILASLFLGLTPIATIIAQARPVCPSISILADATRVTVMQSGKIDLKAEIRTPELGCTVAGSTAKARLSFWVKSAISPEAAVGGPIALLKDGDRVTIDAEQRTIDVDLPPGELERRRSQWQPPVDTAPPGALRKYAQLVSSASLGAVTTR